MRRIKSVLATAAAAVVMIMALTGVGRSGDTP